MVFRLLIIAALFLYQFESSQSQTETKVSVNYLGSTGTHKVSGSTQDFCFTSTSEITFSFSVEGKPGVNDWVGVFESDDCDHEATGECQEEFHNYDGIYLREEKRGNVTLKAPQPLFTEGPVTYRGYYFSDDTYTFLAKSEAFQIETCPGDWTLKFSTKNEQLHRNCFSLALDGKINLDFNIEKPHTTGLQDWIGFYEIGRCTNDRKNVTCPKEYGHEEWAFLNGDKNSPATGAGVQSGTVSIPIPTKKGTYIAYYFPDGGYHWVTETSPFNVECNIGATYSLTLNKTANSKDPHEANHTHPDGCIEKSSHVHLNWNIQGEVSTPVDWVGFYKVGVCDEKTSTCPYGAAAWAFLNGKRYFTNEFIANSSGMVSIQAPDVMEEGTYVAYYFVNDDHYFVAKSEPFDVRFVCGRSFRGFGFAAGMGAFAIVGVLVIILVVIVKKYFLSNSPVSSPGIQYDQLNNRNDEVNLSDDSHEEYDNQISISASSGEDDY